MKNILSKLKINSYTYIFIFVCALCGYLKNITIIFSICLLHELGHVFFIKLFRYKIIKIEILPFGGYTHIDKRINTSINKDILIAFGGILFQLLLFGLLLLWQNKINHLTYNLFWEYNKILIFFNLIPIIPLDGNKICHLILEKFFSYHLAYKINLFLSFLLLISFAFYNYYTNLDNYFIVSFLLYKFTQALKNYKYMQNRFFLERYLGGFEYYKINNQTKDIKDLKKNVYHYFKKGNAYESEKKKLAAYFSCSHSVDKKSNF